MPADLHKWSRFSRALFDSMPFPAFVVDCDVRILDMNRAALPLMGDEPEKKLQERGGDTLQCIQAVRAADGCGTGDACKRCIVRNSVKTAMDGQETVRRRCDMQMSTEAGTTEIHLLVTTSPFESEGERYVLLFLEDITELTQLRSILPICSNCKKIRNDEEYWERVEEYLTKHTHLEFSHSLCPECARELYPFFEKDE